MAILLNKNSLCQHAHANPFCIKTNLRENRFLRSGWRLADKKALTMLKFLLKSRQKTDELTR